MLSFSLGAVQIVSTTSATMSRTMRPNFKICQRFAAGLLCNWVLALVIENGVSVAVERPNIVWLMSEDNSCHYLKMFDAHGTETPRIAELAAHGLQFNHAFSNAPVCSVARTTLMTGCYAPRIGTQYHRRAVSVPMPDGLKMFPAYLRDAGYYTSNNNKKDYNADETVGTWDRSSPNADWRARKADQPFFHMQGFGTTHESSLHFSEKVYETQATKTDPATVFVAPYHPQTDLFRYTVAKYHDNIRAVDQQIGEVVDRLAADDLLEDTFVFYFGDHGGVLPRGKGYAYESGLHVPLVVRVPENFKHLAPQAMGSQVDGFVQFVDFGATVLALAGIGVPAQIDGSAFLGENVSASEVAARDTALGYADRFDEKYDFVRTLRKGKYEYVRNYQPFNFDGLHNNYRYIMLAYQEWRKLFENGQLNETQSAFFRSRPVEMLFDIESDPHEVHNLAAEPQYGSVLLSLREELRSTLRAMPDLSFYPESTLAKGALDNPVRFGQEHRTDIGKLIEVADLSLLPFPQARAGIAEALRSADATERYWALIVCSCFGKQAIEFVEAAQQAAANDAELLNRIRAAEFLGLLTSDDGFAYDPRPVFMDCLAKTQSPIEANLILNSLVLLRDGEARIKFDLRVDSIHPAARKDELLRRLEYLCPDER